VTAHTIAGIHITRTCRGPYDKHTMHMRFQNISTNIRVLAHTHNPRERTLHVIILLPMSGLIEINICLQSSLRYLIRQILYGLIFI
jgi:hypothetical protein